MVARGKNAIGRAGFLGLAVVVVGIVGSVAAGQGYSFTVLPSEVTGSSLRAIARGISGDGNVVVGSSNAFDAQERPYVWRRGAGGAWVREELVGLQGTGRAVSASFDGSTVVGMAGSVITGPTVNAGTPAVWRGVGGSSVSLETPFLTAGVGGGALRGIFSGVSGDGSRAHGFAREVTTALVDSNAYLYQAGSAPVALGADGTLAGGYPASHTMSLDGTRATQYFNGAISNTMQTARLWQDGVGETILAHNRIGSAAYPRTTAISGDGNVVAGFFGTASGIANTPGQPIAWRNGVFEMLPTRPGAPLSYIAGADRTGRVLVGVTGANLDLVNLTTSTAFVSGSEGTLWIDGSVTTLRSYLSLNGVNMGSVIPILVSGVSADGRTVTGVATRPIGTSTQVEYVSFVATIPSAGVGSLACLVGVVVGGRRRR